MGRDDGTRETAGSYRAQAGAGDGGDGERSAASLTHKLVDEQPFRSVPCMRVEAMLVVYKARLF